MKIGHLKVMDSPLAGTQRAMAGLTVTGVAVGTLLSAGARAEGEIAAPDDGQGSLPSVEVTGTSVESTHDVPQSIDTIDDKALVEQDLTLIQDALRNIPGITLNSGEGGAHGDSINLRGLSVPDSFFLDGVRYRRGSAFTQSIIISSYTHCVRTIDARHDLRPRNLDLGAVIKGRTVER